MLSVQINSICRSKMVGLNAFKAFLIEEHEGKTRAGFVDFTADRLDRGGVVVRVAYSSVNYKDALAATGTGRVVRRYPCIGGIDLSGVVESSDDPRYTPGDAVVATGYDLGVAHHGGYAEFARLPADWLHPLPSGLTLFDAMALGTAGFTAALGILRMEENGLRPENGPVIVSGATGGVGSLAVDMLAQAGYQVTALTGKASSADFLYGLGAAHVLLRSDLDLSRIRPLDKAQWAGAVDNLGGDVLAWITSGMSNGGTIASIGLAASHTLNMTVMPFILRGVSLLGIDSSQASHAYRERVWARLGGDLHPRHLALLSRRVPFGELPDVFDSFIQGRSQGRLVVEVGGV